MNLRAVRGRLALAGLALSSLLLVERAPADETIKGEVLGGGAPIANSKVSLFAATADEPKQLAQTKTDDEGRFEVRATGAPADSSLYLLAFGGEPKVRGGGDNPAIALLAVLGSKPPALVVINEMTTVASVWTNAQFLVGATLKGPALGLRIAVTMCPISLISRPADGARRSRTRSTAARRRPWRTSPRSLICCPLVSRE